MQLWRLQAAQLQLRKAWSFCGLGSYLVAGFGDPAGTFELDPYRLARRQIRLQGVWTSDARHLAHAVAVVKKQPEVIKQIGTEYPLEAANEALLAMENRQIIKAVLKPQ